ncbi:hypothetical protein [Zooshikella ganghwensis]|uniref:hypothetical protein n=1 Tax=Zooshikella ganghwensis TaxID=202772 RepID=UPI0003F920EA|nr:hypothetical protein [Zooshikella ganghwensis]
MTDDNYEEVPKVDKSLGAAEGILKHVRGDRLLSDGESLESTIEELSQDDLPSKYPSSK